MGKFCRGFFVMTATIKYILKYIQQLYIFHTFKEYFLAMNELKFLFQLT